MVRAGFCLCMTGLTWPVGVLAWAEGGLPWVVGLPGLRAWPTGLIWPGLLKPPLTWFGLDLDGPATARTLGWLVGACGAPTSSTEGASSITESTGLSGRASSTSSTLTSEEGTAVTLIPAGRFGCRKVVGARWRGGGRAGTAGGELLRSTTSSTSPWYRVEGVAVETSLCSVMGEATACAWVMLRRWGSNSAGVDV